MGAKKHAGRGKPKGTKNGYQKRVRRQGEVAKQKPFYFNPASQEERAFIEEAAKANYPDIARPLPRFLIGAALARAEDILNRPRPGIRPALVATVPA